VLARQMLDDPPSIEEVVVDPIPHDEMPVLRANGTTQFQVILDERLLLIGDLTSGANVAVGVEHFDRVGRQLC
jgi:hypothetical protein